MCTLMPSAAFDNKRRGGANGGYLFDHKALAKCPRQDAGGHQTGGIKTAQAISENGVDCKAVGSGQKALVYLGRYLYRGIAEKNIVANRDGNVTFRYQNSETRKWKPALSAAWHSCA